MDVSIAGRRCRSCGEDKPAGSFYRYRDGRLHLDCYPCHSERSKRWYAENKGARRDQELRRKYGITLADYDQLLKAQSGRCAICGKEERCRNQSMPFSLAVDHDHETGQVRGLLCARCNRVLGQIEQLGLEQVGEYLGCK